MCDKLFLRTFCKALSPVGAGLFFLALLFSATKHAYCRFLDELWGPCSGRSKSRELALTFEGLRSALPSRAEQGTWTLDFFFQLLFFFVLCAAVSVSRLPSSSILRGSHGIRNTMLLIQVSWRCPSNVSLTWHPGTFLFGRFSLLALCG